jgi:putative ABC transport system permease protein
MIFKYSFKSFKAQFYNYLIYFVSMTFAVMVYYCFSAITYNQPLARRAGQNIQIANAMGLGGFLIIMVMLGFMLAVNRFFLLKRSKEIGMYRLVGMRKGQVSLLFFAETLLLGALSLITGIALGMVFSKLFSMILAKAMFLSVTSRFYVSIPSMLETGFVFSFMLVVVSIRSMWIIWRYPLAQLFQPEQERKIRNLLKKSPAIPSLLGLVLIASGYAAAYKIKWITTELLYGILGFGGIFIVPLMILLVCVIGTYLFFNYTLIFFMQLLAKNKKRYYKNLNSLVISNSKLHISSNRNILASVTLLIAGALGMIGLAAFIYTLGIHSVDITDPTDFLVSEVSDRQLRQDITNYPDATIKKAVPLHYKITGALLERKVGKNSSQPYIELLNLISLSNYQEYQTINPYLKPITLKNDQEAVLLDTVQNMLNGFIQYGSNVQLANGPSFTIQSYRPDYLGQSIMRYNAITLVISDQQFQQITNSYSYQLTAFNVVTTDEEALADHVTSALSPNWQAPVYYDFVIKNQQLTGTISSTELADNLKNETVESDQAFRGESWQLNYSSRYPDLRFTRREMGLYVYVVMFVSLLILFITGSILMLRQLFEGEREKEEYDLLKKMGIPDKKITSLIYQQNTLIFFPPMLIGVLHATFAIYLISQFVESGGYWLAYLSCGILVLLYILFYFFTSALYSRFIHSNRR